jgi:hypothetical protein
MKAAAVGRQHAPVRTLRRSIRLRLCRVKVRSERKSPAWVCRGLGGQSQGGRSLARPITSCRINNDSFATQCSWQPIIMHVGDRVILRKTASLSGTAKKSGPRSDARCQPMTCERLVRCRPSAILWAWQRPKMLPRIERERSQCTTSSGVPATIAAACVAADGPASLSRWPLRCDPTESRSAHQGRITAEAAASVLPLDIVHRHSQSSTLKCSQGETRQRSRRGSRVTLPIRSI